MGCGSEGLTKVLFDYNHEKGEETVSPLVYLCTLEQVINFSVPQFPHL